MLLPQVRVLAAFLLLGSLLHGQELRTWQSADGQYSTEAKLLEIRDGVVLLEKRGGERINVPLVRLSRSDQKYIATLVEPDKGEEPELESHPRQHADPIPEQAAALLQLPAQGEFQQLKGTFKQDDHIVALALSDDGHRLAACSANGDCRVWDVASGKALAAYEKDLSKNTSFSLAISPDGKLVLTGGDFNAVHVWDAETGKHRFTHEKPAGYSHFLSVNADGSRMACIDSTGQISSYPTLGGFGTIAKLDGLGRTSIYGDISPNGRYIVFGRSGHSDAIMMHLPRGLFPGVALPLSFPNDRVVSIDVADRFTAMGTMNHRVALQEIGRREGERVKRITVTSRLSRAEVVSVSRDSAFIMAADRAGNVDTWETDVQGFPCSFRNPVENVSEVTISAESRTVAYGHRDGTITVFRLAERPTRLDSRLASVLYGYVAQERFADVERLIAAIQARDARPHWRDAIQRDADILHALTRVGRRFDQRNEHLARLEKWSVEHPETHWPKLALARIAIDAAWDARGSGFASSVTEEGRKDFREQIDVAAQFVTPIADGKDPPSTCFHLLMQVATAQSWKAEKVNGYVKEMMSRFPRHSAAHAEVALGRLPRWGGGLNDTAAYMQSIADQIGGEAGDQVYAEVALALVRFERLERLRLDEPRLVRGLESLCRTFPKEIDLANKILYFAVAHQNRELAKRCAEGFTSGDTEWSVDIWGTKDRFNRAIDFAAE